MNCPGCNTPVFLAEVEVIDNPSCDLLRVKELLNDGNWHGTLEIVQRASVCAVNSAISELRANGLVISTRCIGRGLYEYRLLPMGQMELAI